MDEAFFEQQTMYDDTWSSGLAAGKEQRGNHEVNMRFLEEVGLIRAGIRVLEIGCGIGSVVNELRQKGCQVVGTDISIEAITYGREKYPGLDLQVQPAEALDFEEGSFDMVLSFDLFEHIVESDAHLAEVARVLPMEGHYLLQTPNKYCNALFSTLKCRSLRWKRSHPSLHTWRQLRNRFGRQGFACRFVKMNPVSKFTLAKLYSYKPLPWLVQHIDLSRLPLALQSNLYVVAKKV